MANLTRAQRAAKVAAISADAAASAQTSSADQTKTGDSGAAGDTSAAQNGGGLESTSATTASDVTQDAAAAGALDAANAPPVIETAPVDDPAIAAAGGSGAPAAIKDQDGPTTQPTIGFPLRARVKNNTRMPVQVPALHLDLPASGEATITIYSEGDFKTLHSDLTALFSLNGFGEDAFSVSPAETTEA